MKPSASVFVVEDDEATRNSLELLMKAEGLPCSTFPSAEDFLNSRNPQMCGCLVVDIRLPGMNGLQFQQLIENKQLPLPVIFITGHGDISMAVQAMKHGALEFFEKPYNSSNLISSIKYALDVGIDRFVEQQNKKNLQNRLHSLTSREKEIFELVAQGKMNKLIAYELNISIRTVEVHRAHIMEKLGAKSVADIIHMAMAESTH